MFKRTISVAAACLLVLAAAMAPAVAKKPDGVGQGQGQGQGKGQGKGQDKGKGPKAATTHMKFTLDSHEVESGSDVTGTVLLQTGKAKKSRAPIAGAALIVTLDGVDTGVLLVTGADGTALLTLTGLADGEHNVKVGYAGSETQKRASRAQGFTVGPVTEEPEEDLPIEEEPPAI